jgi:hypothetical protein
LNHHAQSSSGKQDFLVGSAFFTPYRPVASPVPAPLAAAAPAAKKRGGKFPVQEVTPAAAEEVVLFTSAGAIRQPVVSVLQNGQALALVLADAKALRMDLAGNTELEIEVRGQKVKVYYPGILLPWLDNVLVLMVFLKHG